MVEFLVVEDQLHVRVCTGAYQHERFGNQEKIRCIYFANLLDVERDADDWRSGTSPPNRKGYRVPK